MMIVLKLIFGLWYVAQLLLGPVLLMHGLVTGDMLEALGGLVFGGSTFAGLLMKDSKL